MAPTQLEIKVKALRRLVKEEKYYQEELREQRNNVEELKAKPDVDPYDLKKHTEVMQDTERLLPKFYEKLEQFYLDLKNFLNEYDGEEDITGAQEVLANTEKLLGDNIAP